MSFGTASVLRVVVIVSCCEKCLMRRTLAEREAGVGARQEVVVTGVGVILAGCDDRSTLWSQLRSGSSQLRFEPSPVHPNEQLPMGRVRGFEPGRYLGGIPERFWKELPLETLLYLASVMNARADAGLALEGTDRERIGIFDGVSRPAFGFWHDRLREKPDAAYGYRDLVGGQPGQTVGFAASFLKSEGPAYVFNGTCTSGAIAIGHAFREIRDGELDVAFASGHDSSLFSPLFSMYGGAELLSPEREDATRALRPFSAGSGNVFGEGAVTLVLESRTHAERRGAVPLATISAYAFGNNGEHPTKVDTSGDRPARLIARALQMARLSAEDVGFVVGHGNAVAVSDRAEAAYMRRAFGERVAQVPLLSVKPIYGHTLGASSALNAAAVALMLHHDELVPTLNAGQALEGLEHLANGARKHSGQAGLATSFGMGGQNCALLLRKYERQA